MKTQVITAIDPHEFMKELAPVLRDELEAVAEAKAKQLMRAEYLNITESCAYLNLSRSKFYEVVKYTGTQELDVNGKKCYKRSDLDDMMKQFYK